MRNQNAPLSGFEFSDKAFILDTNTVIHKTLQQLKRKKISQELLLAKKWAFFIITIIIPVVALLLLEAGLRIFDYGPNLSLFTTEVIGGRIYHIMNPDVKSRYFSRFEFNPNTSPDYFLVPKPQGTYRIFCLGGSTTVGYPYWYIGSFSTFLRDRLRKLFPEKSIEVINLGLTATNSYTVLDMARELVDYEPDLLIVYDGHNEFYGALGVASNESVGRFRWITQVYLKLIHLRTFLLLRNLIHEVLDLMKNPSAPEPTGTMMERLSRGQYIPYGSDTYTAGLEIFKANIEALVTLCTRRRIPVLIASQVSNLRHQPPFISNDRWTTAALQAQFRIAFDRGLQYWQDRSFDSALAAFQHCVALESLRADVHYHLARCLDTLGRKHEARIEYVKARDYDELRFRTSSDFNNALRQMDNGSTVAFVNIELTFKAHSPNFLIGKELILEHLHPNTLGYFLMAKSFADAMRQRGFLAPKEAWDSRNTLDEDRLWEERSMTELDELCAKKRTEILTSGWPFKPHSTPWKRTEENDPIKRIVDQMVMGKLFWEQGHVAAAEYYEGQGDYVRAEKEYRAIINQIPINVSPYLRIAQMFLRQKKYEDAHVLFLQSLEVEPTVYAYKALGSLAAESGAMTEAISYFENAFDLSATVSERSETGYMLAVAYTRARQSSRAVGLLQQILADNPQFKPARDLLHRINPQSP